VGETAIHSLDDLRRRRDSEVAFLIAKLTLEKYFRADGEKASDRPAEHRFTADVQVWRFPQLLEITREWLAECVKCKDNAFRNCCC
jgi:type III restriction enzyme